MTTQTATTLTAVEYLSLTLTPGGARLCDWCDREAIAHLVHAPVNRNPEHRDHACAAHMGIHNH